MKKIVVTGSLAYDHLMTFDGKFSQSLIVEKLDDLSVSFLADSHVQDFGGCAGNIAYNLKLLGCEPLILGVAGADFQRYAKWLKSLGISTDHVFIDQQKNTASAYVLSDKKQNQISIFSPSAMENYKNGLELKGVNLADIACAIIAPEPPKRMLGFGRYFRKNAVPYIFDPGQAIPAMSKEEILELLKGAVGMILNEYELAMIKKKAGLNIKNGFLIKTTGEKGCEIFEKGKVVKVPAVSGVKVVDVTGCGDAFRAGFIAGYVEGKSLIEACKMANRCAAFALEQRGTQNHKFTRKNF
ncbi:carbohydrate kinase family protein [Candidatus Peregrinibacteria bacterium]|nr:carbohydrate kinase family protein [Candidatus Peregrinibacteria bacterium]